jgi:hypothetical protein
MLPPAEFVPLRVRELDARLRTIILNRLADEHAVVLGVQREQGEGQQLVQFVQHLCRQPLLAHQQRRIVRPACGDIRQGQKFARRCLSQPGRL